MGVYTYASLSELFDETDKKLENNTELVRGLESLDCIGKEIEKSTDLELKNIRLICEICVNGKILIVKTKTGYFIITDHMNTIAVHIHKDKVHIGEMEYNDDTAEVLKYGEAVYLSETKGWIVKKECKHKKVFSGYLKYESTELHLEHLLTSSLTRLINGKSIFISFSGGIDSFLCATLSCKYFTDKKIYLINTNFSKDTLNESKDRKASLELYKEIVKKYNCTNRCHLVENNIKREDILKDENLIVKITKATTMEFNLAALHYFTAKKAKELGGSVIITGTGGDELFLGYSRHRELISLKTDNIDRALKEMVKHDVSVFWESNLHRDYRAGRLCSVSLLSPFLDQSVFDYAVKTAERKSIEKQELKNILYREYPAISLRRKLAGQYGSGIADIIRSIRCRAPTLCRKNECLSLECSLQRK